MDRVEFFLNTTEASFLNWLRLHIREMVGKPRVQGEQTYMLHVPKTAPLVLTSPVPDVELILDGQWFSAPVGKKVVIPATLWCEPGEEPPGSVRDHRTRLDEFPLPERQLEMLSGVFDAYNTKIGGQSYSLGEAISFEIVILASERIEVTARYSPAVAQSFEELLNQIERRWPEVDAVISHHERVDEATDEHEEAPKRVDDRIPPWMVKTEPALKTWDRAYQIMLTMQEDWLDGYLERLDKASPEPSLDDYRRELARDGINYCTKRVAQIKQAGDNDWIRRRLDSIQ